MYTSLLYLSRLATWKKITILEFENFIFLALFEVDAICHPLPFFARPLFQTHAFVTCHLHTSYASLLCPYYSNVSIHIFFSVIQSSLRITWTYCMSKRFSLNFPVTGATYRRPLIIMPNPIHSCYCTHQSKHSHLICMSSLSFFLPSP